MSLALAGKLDCARYGPVPQTENACQDSCLADRVTVRYDK